MNPERTNKEGDGELLQEYADSQDAQAFAEITRRHGPMVFGVSQRITRNSHDAEDVVQEAFVELARAAGSITSLPGWLHRVATNIAKTKIRSAVRRREREQAAVEIKDAEPSSWEEIAPHVDAILAELPVEMREVLVLHFFEGVGQTEIAHRLGVNQSTVSRRVKWGVEQLRMRLRRTGVITSFSLLSLLLADNASAAVLSRSIMFSLGKMALVGLGPSESAAGASTTILKGEMARAAAIIMASVVGIGVLAHFLTRGRDTNPLRTVAADYALIGTPAGEAKPGADDPAAASMLAGPRSRDGRAVTPQADAGDLGYGNVHTDYLASGLSRGRAGAAEIGDLPAVPDEELMEDAALAGSSRGGVGGVGADIDMMAGHRGAYRPLAGGSPGSMAGDSGIGEAAFDAGAPSDTGWGDNAASGPGVGAGIVGGVDSETGSGAEWSDTTGAVGGEYGESFTPPDVSINSFAANEDMLWAFTDLGLYSYHWDSGRWVDSPGGHQLSSPSRTMRVDASGNVIMTIIVDGQTRDQIIGWVPPPVSPNEE